MKANNTSRKKLWDFLWNLPCCSVGNLRRLGRIVVFLLASASAALALDSSERAFTWNEANAVMAAAKVPDDFRHAARLYQALADAGVRNGPLFFNLGTALLQAGQYDNALDALARAERYLGAQPDIRQNMGIALARKQKMPAAAWPWHRVLLFWHFSIASPARAAIAVLAFALFWLALILSRLGLRRGMQALAALALAVFVVFGTSATTTAHQELTAKRYALDITPAQPPAVCP